VCLQDQELEGRYIRSNTAQGTFDNINRNLDRASEFFDNPEAISLKEDDILVGEKMSVINVAGDRGIEFGSILLRDLLKR